ncbi:cytoplasmic dynein heavy chain 1 [Microstroma glucosiphilum]|uniref:Dynein heavy chain, cytoplasmic n=1 Tax=Pseudomicrostroma glucosiphilum TaxID=1684307 RepID=A0A316U741_9BASI|nr:cytoplasmic dynein heavy chain 1 [Pseudomicrostroma glucosiphilum]PWN18755.1 cytoplasmic dynein heavy chain 1 [Pseudomicrostroma glucosiphilum]
MATPDVLASSSAMTASGSASPLPVTFDLGLLRSYLEALLPVLLSAQARALRESLFAGPEWYSVAESFANDSNVMTVYVDKVRREAVQSDDEDGLFEYRISKQPSYTPRHVSSIALIKRVPSLDSALPVTQQLHLLSLFGPASASQGAVSTSATDVTNGEAATEASKAVADLVTSVRESPYEALHSVVHNVMAPWFDAYIASKDKQVVSSSKNKDNDTRMGIPMAKRKFAELELSLLHLQQNVEIPEIHLSVHPIIRATVERCQAAGRKVVPEEVQPQTLLSDSSFLNKLQSDVNAWVKEVQTVTKLDRDVASGTTSQEINFWLSMERAQESIDIQLRSDSINLTLGILRNAKRFHATVSFLADTGLKDCTEKVNNYNLLMKDFPLNDLLSATDLSKARDAVLSIFSHLNKKLRISPYPVKRALPLVEAISRDLNETLLKVLSSQRLMYQEFPTFCDITASVNEVFLAWDDSMKEFVNIAREVTRKRQEKFIPIKVNPEHVKLRDRLAYVGAFRQTHEQLRAMVSSGKGLGVDANTSGDKQGALQSQAGIEMSEEIRAAYESVKVIDVLDVTQEGTEIWSAAEQAYNERVSRVESTLIARLRDLLGQAKSAREMLRVLSQFNSLFVRPKVRGAVQEYQQQLLQSVKSDIQALHDKFKSQYRPSQANHLSQLRDLPEIAGAIVWARQIERQLDVYMKRVEDVLGKDWELFAEGQRLRSESDTFKRKLATRPLFDGWLQDIQRREMSISGRLFSVNRNRATNTFELVVNFDRHVIALFKEVRNLIWLGFQIPHAINNLAKDAKRVYPQAVSLMETVRTYTQTCNLVAANPGIAPLVAQVHSDVHGLISQGMALRWEHFANTYESHRAMAYLPGSGGVDPRENKQVAFVRQFASSVSLFQDKTNELIEMQGQTNVLVEELRTCAYSSTAFGERLAKIQATIDKLNLEGYPNLEQWTADLDKQIEAVLLERLRLISAAWSAEFSKQEGGSNGVTGSSRRLFGDVTNLHQNQAEGSDARRKDKALKAALEQDHVVLKPLKHEIKLQNQLIYLDPPLQYARARWYQQLHSVLGVICGLQRILSARYEIGLQVRGDASSTDRTYTSLLTQLQDQTLVRPFGLIESKVAELDAYLAKWLQFQSLWDLDEQVAERTLGDSLSKWQDLLSSIRKARTVFDNSETHLAFGSVVTVEYGQVATKVNAKYDSLQRMFTSQFATRLGNSMREIHSSILKTRNDLEQGSIEASSTASTVNFVMLVEDTKRKVKVWGSQVEVFASGEKILQRQRHTFPTEWLWVDQVEGQYSALNEILARKDAGIQEQRAGLELKIMAEDKILSERLAVALEAWEAEKPIQGQSTPERSLSTLGDFEGRFNKLVEDRTLMVRAKEALSIPFTETADNLEPALEELRDLKAVWTALSGIWKQLEELRATKWANVPAARKLRQQIDGLLDQTKSLPARMRQYAAAEHCAATLRALLKTTVLISELNGDAMRDRHWRTLWKRLGKGHYTSSLTLGAVWDLDLKKNETVIKEVVAIAAGEAACESFLRETREAWTSYTLDLVRRGDAHLIRHFDALFGLAGDHLSALRQMTMSPHYKTFEEEARGLTERLERVLELFEVYADAQTRYVYLAGIFHGSNEIRAILPAESSRFQSVEAEFISVMRKVSKSPFVFDVIVIPGILRTLERQADLLTKIQKALGEFLERQRAMTPRLYFLGDGDLLQLIGNKDLANISSSLSKMFGGIATIETDASGSEMTAMVSREGEKVELNKSINLSNAKVNDWLAQLETQMKSTLASRLNEALLELRPLYTQADVLPVDDFMAWMDKVPAQLTILAAQVLWTELVEADLKIGQTSQQPLAIVLKGLDLLADTVLRADIQPLLRRKCEGLVTELVLQRDLSRQLIAQNVTSPQSWEWQRQMRFYWLGSEVNKVEVYMADAKMDYAWEYLGAADRLVTTPLTLRAFSVLTQARNAKMGSSLFGPAGTGKTESAKALSARLGQMSIVVNCDEGFDLPAMGRIFIGLCRVGASACFDEFNRLSEAVLSAVSQQIQTIQGGLAAFATSENVEIELGGKTFPMNSEVAINITTNPTYAGRSALPINLKKLFRSVAMTHPDRELIAQVMLFSQGFRTSEALASKVVPFFGLCAEQLSPQSHYDFGLRALKSVLVSAGQLKRDRLEAERSTHGSVAGAAAASSEIAEQEILIQSITETIVPKLVGDDVPLLSSLLSDVFPGVQYKPANLEGLLEHVRNVCREKHLVCDGVWQAKIIQLYQIHKISHGLMLVGPSGTGKTEAWQVLLSAMQRFDGIEGVSYVIDPKAISKDSLYGKLDPTTREWIDGLFTSILRKIVDNARGEASKRHWIVFDGDVDPEWVENLNSVLDDNKLLTLPNGERLSLPPNVRIVFEVENLRYATLATVSRCGMIWFSNDSVTPAMTYSNYLGSLRSVPLGSGDEDIPGIANARLQAAMGTAENEVSPELRTQQLIADTIAPFFNDDGLVGLALQHASEQFHIMDFTFARAVGTLFSLINKTVRNVLDYNGQHSDFPLSPEIVEQYAQKRLLISILWAFTGDSKLDVRAEMGEFLTRQTSIEMPSLGPGSSLIDFDVLVNNAEWFSWVSKVPSIEIETAKVSSADVVIPTVDTVRHEEVLYSWLSEHKPLMLCGPPGSGKTMTLFSALRKLPDQEVVGLNFSSATTPELILKTFDQYCEYRKTPSGVVLAPVQLGKWIVLFCDEINLPSLDKYGTQRVISFLRQLVERGGFWRPSDRVWVRLERIQFVGACNPPTDPGRVPLTHRFLRHAPLVMVDYPGEISLNQIYGTFNRALLKVTPNLRGYAEPLTSAMVDFYLASQKRFTADQQAHYVYSPRELTRWMRGVYEAIKPLDDLTLDGLVRIWAYEGLRLFQDRLVFESEKQWTDAEIDATARQHFPVVGDAALARPILFSNWLTRTTQSVDQEALRRHTSARLAQYSEEELDIQKLVLHDSVLDVATCIDRVLRQRQGHVLLIGVSGSGRATLTRFVSWMNGLGVFTIASSNKYSMADFNEDLKGVLRRAGTQGEKLCFMIDESQIKDPAFLEAMNTLLANSEVPGLFEGDEYSALMTACKEGSQRDGLLLDSPEELYGWFQAEISRNLHVVFTMNPPEQGGMGNRAAASPALFNRTTIIFT